MPKGKKARKEPEISAQLITNAENGGVEDLYKLHSAATCDNCTVNIVRAVIKHLHIDLAPNVMLDQHKDPVYTLYGQRALPSMSILSTVVGACEANPKLKEDVVPLLLEAIEGLFPWLNFLLHFGLSLPMDTRPGTDFRNSYFAHAQFLCDLIELDPRLHRAVLTTPTFSDLLIRLWMTTGKLEQQFMSLNAPTGCPILSIFLKTVKDDEGRDVFLERVFARPRFFWTSFAECMIERAEIVKNTSFDTTPPQRIIGYIDGLLTATQRLLISKVLRRRFLEVNYLTQFAGILNGISEAVVSHGSSQLLKPMLRPANTLGQLAYREAARTVLNWRDLVAGDFLPLIVRIMASLRRTGDDPLLSLGSALINLLGSYTIYPSVITLFFKTSIPEGPTRALSNNPKIAGTWGDFRKALGRRAKVLIPFKDAIFSLCDNPTCDRSHPSEELSQQCSGCSSVVYCSKKCQKRDWKLFHREECPRARGYTGRRRSTESRYFHTTREYHMAYIESKYNEHYQEIKRESAACHPSLAFHEVVPTLVCTSTVLSIDIEPLTDENDCGWETPKTVFIQTYLKPRFQALVSDYRAGKAPRDVHVVEGIFPLGDLIVSLTVKFKRQGDSFKAVYSLYRYGSKPRDSV